VLRHQVHVSHELAEIAWEEDHNDWGPVLDISAYERKVAIYTREWNLPEYPVAKYYRFDFLKQALDELKLLRSWDSALDAAYGSLTLSGAASSVTSPRLRGEVAAEGGG
jgi:hypothetical protein